ncbi:hypothetical protein RN001_015109 [Aquatica leii]|uniref:Uncharacterized protein n=1 Tax=Aquatica leii TaxID=1421715 RepID=A0AAN7PZ32_9COLE|nr:hypothetical protein RN001_015109 [Aquatica leii]
MEPFILFCAIVFATANCDRYNDNETSPLRRFYIINPEIIPHAVAALNMLIPQPSYNTYPQSYYEHEDIEQESGHSHDSKPIGLITFIKAKQQKQRIKKRRPNGKRVKKIKKGPTKCMPFKVRFTKKSDNKYFYGNKFAPLQRVYRPHSSWSKMNKWRVAPPGAKVTKYTLQEPIPSVISGTPPAAPLYNIYKDNRIPVNEVITPTYIHLLETTNIYNDSEYYQSKSVAPISVNLTEDVLTYKNFASTEKVPTVTPTTGWIPLPKYYRVTQTISKDDGNNLFLTKRCSIQKCWESSTTSIKKL